MMNRVTEPNASSFASLEKTFVDRWQAVLLIAGLVAISLNQRPALVAVGPLTAQLRAETGMGAAATSLLTTLPLLCFGVFALLAPMLGRWIRDSTGHSRWP